VAQAQVKPLFCSAPTNQSITFLLTDWWWALQPRLCGGGQGSGCVWKHRWKWRGM